VLEISREQKIRRGASCPDAGFRPLANFFRRRKLLFFKALVGEKNGQSRVKENAAKSQQFGQQAGRFLG